MKVQIFSRDDLSALQDSINKFFEQNRDIEISHILQSESAGTIGDSENISNQQCVTISIFYTESILLNE